MKQEVDVGLAADIGTLSRFPKIIGSESVTRELALSARPFKADEALRIGFVSRVVPGSRDEVVSAAVELAKVIALKSPIAVVGTKHLLLHARDNSYDSTLINANPLRYANIGYCSVRDSLTYTATWNQLMLQTSVRTRAVS